MNFDYVLGPFLDMLPLLDPNNCLMYITDYFLTLLMLFLCIIYYSLLYFSFQ